MASKASLIYPLPAFHFSVSFLELFQGGAAADLRFLEVSGLSAELVTEDLAVGGENGFVYKMPVRTKFPNLVLKRGLSEAPSKLTKWAESTIYDFDIKPVTVLVTLLNDLHLPVSAWSFKNAYPVKMTISDLNAQNNAIVIETIELAYQFSKKMSLGSAIPF
jgi:phage tail-like protein